MNAAYHHSWMTAGDRAERDAGIVGARLKGETWPAIAKANRLSERQCRRVFAGRDSHAVVSTDPDLADDVQAILCAYESDLACYRRRAATTRNQGAELAALRASLRTMKARMSLLDALDVLPRRA